MCENINNYNYGVYCHLSQTIHILRHHNKGTKANKIANLLELHLNKEKDDGG